jgi:DNA adenine methylase
VNALIDFDQPVKTDVKPGKSLTPFLKWAGGKRWLTQQCMDIFPIQYERYIEPFLGSAAVFFHLQPKFSLLTDVNFELINAYSVIKRKRHLLAAALIRHDGLHNDEYFYKIRSASALGEVERAARFIYLNRTCWNGLYRVNKMGEFNVPRGTKNSVIIETDNFEAISKALSGATIKASDFEASIDEARKGDLLFLDPPYTVKHNNNGFIKYNDKIFSWNDQLRLQGSVMRANKRGVKVVMTNANHASVRELYAAFRLSSLARHSILSGKREGRGKTEELLVKNF